MKTLFIPFSLLIIAMILGIFAIDESSLKLTFIELSLTFTILGIVLMTIKMKTL